MSEFWNLLANGLSRGVPHRQALNIGLSFVLLAPTLSACASNEAAPYQPMVGVADAGYDGTHDLATCDQIAGWVMRPDTPSEPVNVDIHSDDTLVATLPADIFREDLLRAGKGNGYHGFVYSTPHQLKDGHPHSILVTVAGRTIALRSSPRTITCRV